MKDSVEVTITAEGQEALDANGPNGGIVKIHGLDDTAKITATARALSSMIKRNIIPVEVMCGTYAGVMFVIDPEGR